MSAEAPLTPEERAACAVCADWLAGGAAASVLALMAMAAVLLAAAHAWPGEIMGRLAVLPVLVVIERWFALRVAFDARLFARLANGELESLAALDRALTGVLGVSPAKAGRPLAPRIAGARRLYRLQLAGTLGLVLLAVAAWWPL